MSRRSSSLRRGAWAAALAMLTACGGGGGQDTRSVALTAGNADAASRAAASSLVAFGGVDAVPLTDTLASAPDRRALASARGGEGGWHRRVLTLLRGAASPAHLTQGTRRQPLAVVGPVSEPCLGSGSVTVTLDDRDDDEGLSIGDRLTVVFGACRDGRDTIDGQMVITVSGVDPSPPSVTAEVDAQALTVASDDRTSTLDGTLRLAYTLPNGDDSLDRIELTALGNVVVDIDGGPRFSDRLTLLDGWQMVSMFYAVPDGRATTSTSGRIDSAATGGTFTVSTPWVMQAYGEDAYPREGMLRLDGAASAVRLTALSAVEVRLDLDADGDGVWESSRVVAWADLL